MSPGAADAGDPFSARPAPDEYGRYYADYVAAVPDGDVRATLRSQAAALHDLLAPLDDAAAGARYAPGKWSLKEVVGHLVDSERVFAGRLLRFARSDEQGLPGMDQDLYVASARFDERPWASLLGEHRALREADLELLGSLRPEWLDRGGVASGAYVTVRGLAWILAGHERHHLDVVRARYLG